MHRSSFLVACFTCALAVDAQAAADKKFVFKIKTESGGIVGNIVIEAKDILSLPLVRQLASQPLPGTLVRAASAHRASPKPSIGASPHCVAWPRPSQPLSLRRLRAGILPGDGP
jgi:hypothetical protein